MDYAGQKASCQAVPRGPHVADVVCGGGQVSGNFASDCSNVSYNGIAFNKSN